MPSPYACQGQKKWKNSVEEEIEPDESWENISMAAFWPVSQRQHNSIIDIWAV